MTYWTQPLVVEAAISPVRLFNEPQVVEGESLVEQANSCFAMGAGIVHHHHDYRLGIEETANEMIQFGRGVLQKHPDALFYGDYVQASTFDEKMGHLPALEKTGTLRMIAVDPGVASYGDWR